MLELLQHFVDLIIPTLLVLLVLLALLALLSIAWVVFLGHEAAARSRGRRVEQNAGPFRG